MVKNIISKIIQGFEDKTLFDEHGRKFVVNKMEIGLNPENGLQKFTVSFEEFPTYASKNDMYAL
jgi:hypothetical protein